VRREHPVTARQVHARCRDQCGQARDEIQRCEDHVRRTVPVGVAYSHFFMIRQATQSVYGADLLEPHLPAATAFMEFMGYRPHVQG
jgi:hypothetical protein